ncbi:MAG: HTTM domain-containing protein [Bacteroidota bacterium]
MAIERIKSFLFSKTSVAPLVVFRIAFGVMMFLSMTRFMANGWIEMLYVQPKIFFPFYGFEWIKPLNETGMYAVFVALAVATLFVALGLFYRASIITFFLLFTYVELIDKTNYLNHYYFISIMNFLMALLPANKKFSLDILLGITKPSDEVPRWTIFTLQLQMATVYFFAGIAKINPDWLLNAMPLKIWLVSKSDLPLIGSLLTESWAPYLFSWCGMLFDVSIAIFLFNRRTVWYAYAFVIIFHVLTAILFPGIGMFPYIMIVCAMVFLPSKFHEKLLQLNPQSSIHNSQTTSIPSFQYAMVGILTVHFLIQVALPLRYTFYPDNLFYTEQGYRFSWRVMLMEKAGTVFFQVKNVDGKLVEINNSDFLTIQQEKQMSTQPDMILQFAHHLKEVYHTNEVYAEAYVCVNGRGSRLFIDPKINLAEVNDDFSPKKWILADAR